MEPVQPTAMQVAALQGQKIDALRAIWRRRYGEPPPVRSGDVLRRLLAEKIQMEGQPRDSALERELAQLARLQERGAALAPPSARFKTGTVLVREHDGVMHRVEVVEGGFHWNSRRWKSLSEIAREITGVRWNGPRFFGLREPRNAA